MYELIWLNSVAIIIYYICCTNDAILLYENIFLLEKGLHRRFVSSTGGVDVPITNGSGTGGDGPAITNDLNPTVLKTVGDGV